MSYAKTSGKYDDDGIQFNTKAQAIIVRDYYIEIGYKRGDWDWTEYTSGPGTLCITSTMIHAVRHHTVLSTLFDEFQNPKVAPYIMDHHSTLSKDVTGLNWDVKVVTNGFKAGCQNMTATQAAALATFILDNVKET